MCNPQHVYGPDQFCFSTALTFTSYSGIVGNDLDKGKVYFTKCCLFIMSLQPVTRLLIIFSSNR